MQCPSCGSPMAEHTLAAHMGASVTVDLCATCQALWFDGRESLQLAPGSTLALFRLIGEAAAAARQPLPSIISCPRCRRRLDAVEDMQRTTRFRYRRCPDGHGRFITFFDFLREKDFIRPLSAQQLADLRAHVQAVNCSNCGAPVDLARGSTCEHCRSPLSMLDMAHTQRMLDGLREASAPAGAVSPTLGLDLLRARREAERAFADAQGTPSWYAEASSTGTVGAGLRALARWLGRIG